MLLRIGKVAGLLQVHGPQPRVGPQPVRVLAVGPDHGVDLVQEGVGVGEVTFVEHVGEDADHVVLVLGVVAVRAGVEPNPAAIDLGVDEAGPVGVHELRVGQGEPDDLGELRVPERPHMGEMLAPAAGPLKLRRCGPGIAVPESVGDDDVVVFDGPAGRHGVRGVIQRQEAG